MDLDKEYSSNPANKPVSLASIIDTWLSAENMRDSFSIIYPRANDTIVPDLEGWLRYDHHSEGFATVITIYNNKVYIDYDAEELEASDPEFFTKLKNVLKRHEAVHANCKHIRNIND